MNYSLSLGSQELRKQRPDYTDAQPTLKRFMKRKVRLRITTASRQTIRLRSEGLKARCLACEREVEMVTEGEAREILQADDPALDRLVAGNNVHAIQTVSGNWWVCKDSLFSR